MSELQNHMRRFSSAVFTYTKINEKSVCDIRYGIMFAMAVMRWRASSTTHH